MFLPSGHISGASAILRRLIISLYIHLDINSEILSYPLNSFKYLGIG